MRKSVKWLNFLKVYGSGLLSGLVIALLINFFFYKTDISESPNILIKEVTKEIPCEKIKVYRPKVKKALKLPETVSRDRKSHVVASTRILNDGHTHVLTAVYNESQGDVKLFDQKEPLPWLNFNKRTTLAFAYGASNIETSYQVSGNYRLLSMKKLHVELHGNARSDQSWFGGIQLRYSF